MAPIPRRIAGTTVTQKNPSVSTPSFPSFLGFPSPATPEKITAITNGITTIRIAFMNAVPRGAEAWATAIRVSEPVTAASRPKPRPATRPTAIAMWSMPHSGSDGGCRGAIGHPRRAPSSRAGWPAPPMVGTDRPYQVIRSRPGV